MSAKKSKAAWAMSSDGERAFPLNRAARNECKRINKLAIRPAPLLKPRVKVVT